MQDGEEILTELSSTSLSFKTSICCDLHSGFDREVMKVFNWLPAIIFECRFIKDIKASFICKHISIPHYCLAKQKDRTPTLPGGRPGESDQPPGGSKHFALFLYSSVLL